MYTHSVQALDVALQINTALQILEMNFFQFGGNIEFLNNSNSNWGRQTAVFLAHLSRSLTGELIGYPWIRRPSVVRPSVHIFKHLLL